MTEQQQQTSAPQALARCANTFGLALYGQLRQQAPGNLVASPFSVWLALAMLRCGARDQTAAELSDALALDEVGDQLPEAVAKLRNELLYDSGIQLSIANALWVQDAYPLLTSFVKPMEAQFGAVLEGLDFANAEESAERINRWVARETCGLIPEIVKAGELGPGTLLVLTNALYFKRSWEATFSLGVTKDLPFATPTGRAQVPTMAKTNTLRYLETPELQLTSLPYEGGRFAMDLLLPRQEQGLGALEASLDWSRLESLLSRASHKEVLIYLPRFTLEWGQVLNEPIQALGARLPFEERDADFSPATGTRDLCLSRVLHRAKVAVNEAGTEAGAATVVEMLFGCAEVPPEPVLFRADHPFLFLIREVKTNVVLFMGRVTDPR